jgi:adenylate kinase family enzyme
LALVERDDVDVDRRRHASHRAVVRPARALSLHPPRLVVVGGPGSGKSTLAAELATRLGLDHVELDALWWEAAWTAVGADELRARLTTRLDDATATGWVVDGNYLDEVGRDVAWPAAATLVWLDLPRRVAYPRAVGRTIRRLVGRQALWNGNRETVRNLSPGSLLRLWRRWPDYSARIGALVSDDDTNGPVVVRLRTDAEVRAWVEAYVSAV